LANIIEIVFNVKDKSLRSAKKNAKELETQTDKTQKSAFNLKKAYTGLARVVAATGIAAGIKKVVDINRQFEQSLSELRSITGVTAKELEVYAKAATRIGSETGKSANEIVASFKLIGSARPELLKSQDALIGVTESAVTLSQAAGIQVPEAAEALTNALNQFNIPAERSAEVIDALANGSLRGAAAIPQINAAITSFGAVAGDNNVTLQQSVALVEVLADKTIQGAEAGTALRNSILILKQDTKNFTDGAFDLEKALTNLNADYESGADLTKRFGRENVTAATILAKNVDRYEELLPLISEYGTAQKQAEINTDTLNGAVDRLGSAFDKLAINLGGGGALSNALKNITDEFASLINTIAESDLFLDRNAQALLDIEKAAKGLDKEALQPLLESYKSIDRVTAISFLKNRIEELTEATAAARGEAEDLSRGSIIRGTGEETEEALANVQRLAKETAGLNFILSELEGEAGGSSESIEGLGESLGNTSNSAARAIGTIGGLEQKISDLNKQLKEATSQEQIIKIRAEIETAQGELDRLGGGALDVLGQNAFKDIEKLSSLGESAAEQISKGLTDGLKERSGAILPALVGSGADGGEFELPEELRDNLINFGTQVASIFSEAALTKRQEEIENEIDAINQRYNREVELAGDNAQAIASIEQRRTEEIRAQERRRVEIEKRARIRGALIDTAANVIRSILNAGGVPIGLPAGAIAAALGAAQVAAIRGFKEGVIGIDGPGTSTSDSIPAWLSKGESVIRAKETSEFRPTLEAIHSGKIRPDVLNALVQGKTGGTTVNLNNKELIDAINSMPNERTVIDETGFQRYWERRGSRVKLLNKRRFG
jgi:TP901 family phage tail tape measure protein